MKTSGELIPKQNAAAIARVNVRIMERVNDAIQEHRMDDALKIAQIYGGMTYRQFQGACMGELDVVDANNAWGASL